MRSVPSRSHRENQLTDEKVADTVAGMFAALTDMVAAPSRGPQHSIRTRAQALALAIAA